VELQTAKIISAPSQESWSQAYIDSDLLAVIKIEKESDPSLKAKEIIFRFNELYPSATGSELLKIKTALKKIQNEFADLRLEMIVGVVWHEVFYLAILNQGKVILSRGESLVSVLEAKEGLVTASGFIKENDLFVLGTKRFFGLIPALKLEESLKNKEPDEVAEVLMPFVQAKEVGGGAAALIVKLGKAKAPIEVKKERLLDRLKEIVIKLKDRPKPIYLPRRREKDERKQRMMLTVAISIAILLMVSVVFGWQKRKREEEVSRFNQFWEEIEYKYNQGKELVEISPSRARELLQESLNLAREKKEDFSSKNWQYKKLAEREKEIEAKLEEVLREFSLAELPVFLDLGLVKKELRGKDFDFWEKKLVVLGEDGTIIKIDFNKKSETLGKIEGSQLVGLWADKVFVFGNSDEEKDDQVFVFSNEGKEVVAFEVFAGNLYVLEKEGIFKYPGLSSEELEKISFGDKQNWLGSGVEPDLTEAVDMAIDGDIWILLANGEILKFGRGSPKAFGLSGLDQELNQPSAFYTDEDSQKIYVLDKTNKRIVVFFKSGEYDSQYLFEKIKEVDDLVVSEEEKKILLLSKEKIYEIELR
jgi:hypothetical protein